MFVYLLMYHEMHCSMMIVLITQTQNVINLYNLYQYFFSFSCFLMGAKLLRTNLKKQ